MINIDAHTNYKMLRMANATIIDTTRQANTPSIHPSIHQRIPTGGAESYEDLEGRGQRIRQILDSSDSFNSDTPLKVSNRGEGSGDKRGGGAFPSSASQEGNVMVAFTLKEVDIFLFSFCFRQMGESVR